MLALCSCFKNNLTAQKNSYIKNHEHTSGLELFKFGFYSGVPQNFGVAMQGKLSHKYSAGIDAMLIPKNANLPRDYSEGLCLFGNCTPQKNLGFISLHINKEFAERKNLNINFSTGISWAHLVTPVFTPSEYRNSWFNLSSNYNTIYQARSAIGLLFNIQQEWKASKTISFNLSVRSNINSIKTMVLLNAGIGFNIFLKQKLLNKLIRH